MSFPGVEIKKNINQLEIGFHGWALLDYDVMENKHEDFVTLVFLGLDGGGVGEGLSVPAYKEGRVRYLIFVDRGAGLMCLSPMQSANVKLVNVKKISVLRVFTQLMRRFATGSALSFAVVRNLISAVSTIHFNRWLLRISRVTPEPESIADYALWYKKYECFRLLPWHLRVRQGFSGGVNLTWLVVDGEKWLFPELNSTASQNKTGISFQDALSSLRCGGCEWLLVSPKGVFLDVRLKRMIDVHVSSWSERFDFVYTDIDAIDDEGKRSSPEFRGAWDKLYFSQFNYIDGAVFIRKEFLYRVFLVESPHGVNSIEELLKVVSKYFQESRILHIPEIWFHDKHRAGIEDSKLVDDSGLLEIESVQGSSGAGLSNPAIIIPTRDQVQILRTAVSSILNLTSYECYSIVIVDNGSECQDTIDYLKEVGKRENVFVIHYPYEFNYSAINNYAVAFVSANLSSDCIVLMNNDIEVIVPHWLNAMLSCLNQPDVGVVGAKLYYPNRTIQHAGVVMGMYGVAGHAYKYLPMDDPGPNNCLNVSREVCAVTAACMLTSLDVFQQVGGLNEKDLSVAFNDIDYCLKVREQGRKVIWSHRAEFIHHESFSRGDDLTGSKKKRFISEVSYMKKRWKTEKFDDPFYNKNYYKNSHFCRLRKR